MNPSRFKGENFRDIPLLADKEVWLKKDALDADGNPVLDEDGKQVKDIVKVMPAQLKEAINKGRETTSPRSTTRRRTAARRRPTRTARLAAPSRSRAKEAEDERHH